MPSAMFVFALILFSYFLVTGGKAIIFYSMMFVERYSIIDYLPNEGIIYDVIVEPPSIGSTTDERGNSRPVFQFIFT